MLEIGIAGVIRLCLDQFNFFENFVQIQGNDILEALDFRQFDQAAAVKGLTRRPDHEPDIIYRG